MNLNNNLDLVRAEYLRRLSLGNGTLLRQIGEHIASRTGKLLRPHMLLAAAATRGPETLNSHRTLLLAVAVEMLHNASLLHDDVLDHATTRRTLPSANALWGNNVAVLAGDYLLAQTMTLLHEADDPDAAQRINNTVKLMVEAELLQHQLLSGALQPSAELYLQIVDGKTAALFATAAALGNPLYNDFGLHFGRLFQLQDDIADNEDTPYTRTLIQQEKKALAHCTQLQENEFTKYII